MTDLAERRGFDEEVYAPAEDSALLAGVVAEWAGPNDRVLDVGTGSGYVAWRVARETAASVVGTDVNPIACRRARERGVETVRCDLGSALRGGRFDVVAANPPYLPGVAVGEDGTWLDAALVGGEDGRAVIERLVDDLSRLLADSGVAFLLVSTVTGVDEVVEYAGARGFSSAAEVDATFPGETLTVLRLWE